MRLLLPLIGLALASVAATPPARLEGPRVDHHQHLLSPDLAPIMARAEESEFKAVALPPDMEDLLRRRTAAWNDSGALASLYADQVVLAQYADQTLLLQDAILTGRETVSGYLATGVFARAYAITPFAYSESGPVRHIAAVFARPQPRGDVRDYRHVAIALFTVGKQASGQWLITSEAIKFPGPPTYKPVDADALVKLLDEAGIERAVVLSSAYIFESPSGPKQADAAARLRAENDWTAREVARHPTRLIGFCAVNPLTDTALPEVERCAKDLGLAGLKLHFSNSGVDLSNPAHVARVQQVFAAANRLKLTIVVHLATGNFAAGRSNAEVFLQSILPRASDVVVQIAHLAGSGPGWNDEALEVFAKAIEAKDPRTRNLYFDVATVADLQGSDRLERLAQQIRRIGPQRILFGSDAVFGGRKTPNEEWGTFRGMVPLTDAEFAVIRDNVAPYMRGGRRSKSR
jgi:predicted TIM-barrel fold metal-dependent hydrolase